MVCASAVHSATCMQLVTKRKGSLRGDMPVMASHRVQDDKTAFLTELLSIDESLIADTCREVKVDNFLQFKLFFSLSSILVLHGLFAITSHNHLCTLF